MTEATDFFYNTGIFFLILLTRYFVTAGIFYVYYMKLKSGKDKKRILSRRAAKKSQIKKEIYWSTISSVVFAVFGALTYLLYLHGNTAIYIEPEKFGYWYLPVSLVLVLFIHETYYYWMHRVMHFPRIYKWVHKVHHKSLSPTPWSSFSFHPWESLLEAIILPVVLIVIPVNLFVLGFYLVFMTISSVINHLDIEIYPASFQKSSFGRFLIGATHHHFHHEEFSTNYGLYFTFWDRIMGTQSSKM